MEKLVLGIETSCDDTSICILKEVEGKCPAVLSLKFFGQEEILTKWGGVVPEIAARNHLEKITPLLKSTFEEANLNPSDISLIAVTTNPGLLGPLLTGLNAAKTMSLYLEKPITPVNHIYAHLEAIHLSENIEYPYLGLVISGGHTLFTLVNSPSDVEILGGTIDDAAGEAFDKGGKILGLGYPAGRVIDDLSKKGDKEFTEFPIGLKKSGDCNLSYSGLKTALLQYVEKNPELVKTNLNDICASYQHAIIAAIKMKLKKALKLANEKTSLKKLPIVVGGGVACNSYLREVLNSSFTNVHFVLPRFCTDNGAMIANWGLRAKDQQINFPECLSIDARSSFISKSEKRAFYKKGSDK